MTDTLHTCTTFERLGAEVVAGGNLYCVKCGKEEDDGVEVRRIVPNPCDVLAKVLS